jgi:hypothetical protein
MLWPLAVATGVLLPVVAVGAWLLSGLFGGGPAASAPAPPDSSTGQVAAKPPFQGWIDVVVSEGAEGLIPNNPGRQRLRLHEPKARPLRPGDEIKLEVELNRPGYCYVVWFDAERTPSPIYPWEKLDWANRPRTETAVQKLWLPPGNLIYPINPSPPGLETLLLLVRDTPLPSDVKLRELLGAPEPQAYANLNYVAWFKNGVEVADEVNRAAGEPRKNSNPAVRLQDRIQEKWGPPLFDYSRAVVFGNLGKK